MTTPMDGSRTMSTDLTLSFTVDQSPEEAFAAITDVRAWWSGTIEGPTDRLGAEFSYSVPDIHRSTFRITELEPARRVSWLVLDAWLSFTEDPEEWAGTTVTFDLSEVQGRTLVRFTHVGLSPEQECYEVCHTAWGQYVLGSLRSLIESGAGRPNSFEGQAELEAALAGTVPLPR